MTSLVEVNSLEDFEKALSLYSMGKLDQDPSELLENGAFLLEKDGSYGLFEPYIPRVLTGHYFFKVRGKDAYDLAVEMLRKVFDDGVEAVRGLVPEEHKASGVLTRKLGFVDYGDVETHLGVCRIFVMTNSVFNRLHGKNHE